MKHYFGVSFLPVLMAHSRVAERIMLHVHSMDYQGRDTTLVTATQTDRLDCWGKEVGQEDSVPLCPLQVPPQEAGWVATLLPPCLTVPGPPFLHVGLDLFGPMVVKKMGGSKTTREDQGTFKVWGLLILCSNTKAVKLYVAAGYSTAL